jgi:hypothetical protein
MVFLVYLQMFIEQMKNFWLAAKGKNAESQ